MRKVVTSFRSEWEQFEQLARTAARAMDKLPNVVVDALFHLERHDIFYVDQDDADEFKSAIQDGQLRENDEVESDFATAVVADSDDPNVEAALSKLRALRKFVEGTGSEFERDYKSKYKERLDMKLRPFWIRHLGLH